MECNDPSETHPMSRQMSIESESDEIHDQTRTDMIGSTAGTTYFDILKTKVEERARKEKQDDIHNASNDVKTTPCNKVPDNINDGNLPKQGEGASNITIDIEDIQPQVSSSSTSSIILCRICYEGKSKENLISPCKCMGTMGYLHRSCIEKWLGSSNSDKCEICNFEYVTVRQPKPIAEWLCRPTRRSDRRNLWADFVCFLLLTPLAGVSAWLCASGAMAYSSSYEDGEWEAIGLAALSVFLVSIYFVWCGVAMRYHYNVFHDWSEHHQDVRVMDLDQLGQNNPRLNAGPSEQTVLSLD